MNIRLIRISICCVSALLGLFWIVLERVVAPNLSAQDGLLFFLLFGSIAWVTTSPAFFRRYVGEATPESLGAIRIITCAIQVLMTLWLEDLPSSALLPIEIRHSMGAMSYFYNIPGFESFARSQSELQIFEWITALILFLGMIGWKTRIVIPLGAFCYIILGGIVRQYTWFYHTGLIPVYVMVVLSLTPCADGLSVDRLWNVYRGKTVPVSDEASAIYGWSRYACWVIVALSYVAAGLSKIYKSGFFWWDPANMKGIILSSTLDPVQANWEVALKLIHAPDILFAFLGITGMYGEIAVGLVLFSKIARQILPICMVMLHLGILFLQDILFFDLIVLQLIFYDFTEIRQGIKRWRGRESINVRKNEPNNNDLKDVNDRQAREALPTATKGENKKLYYPIMVATFAAIMIFVWFRHIEFYPITSLQMFSGYNNSQKIGYTKIIAHYESGFVTRLYPDTIIHAPMNTRYRLTIRGCILDNPKGVQSCNKLLNTLRRVHNKTAIPGQKITKFEVQSWLWDFNNNPSDPDYGELVKSYTMQVEEE
ncbi:hypothetical protein [Limnofasciculus baicalensis]|uniref:HTTM domain-containing protein n=1 Tax=Limnofasciculus baicalensis BBK-W-15 TaxID=2699891 RepID=A0AAE3KM91_9CYAN|nr:hypothetical protein [Limnofasciculus baicalensis]MCP2728969.1 hypothetical protein [Limnofasciculus baicalensis BBK-W-15]